MKYLTYLTVLLLTSYVHAQVGVGTTTPISTLHVEVKDQNNPLKNEGIMLPRVNKLPSENPDEAGVTIYLTNDSEGNGKGIYTWNGNEWKLQLSEPLDVTIPSTPNYSASSTEYPLAAIYEKANFTLNFYTNCYNKSATVFGEVDPTTNIITVRSFEPFGGDSSNNGLNQVTDNLTDNVQVGNHLVVLRLVMNNNQFSFVIQSNGCGSITRLTSGVISYNSLSDSSGGTWKKNIADIYYSSGNVGIGIETPTEALDVVGNIHFSGTLSNLSDKRMKENIKPFSDGLNEVSKLQPVTYNYNNTYGIKNTTDTHLGLIAQDVELVAPYLIKDIPKKINDKEVDLKAVKYNDIILMLINSTKELKEKIEILEAEIINLKKQN